MNIHTVKNALTSDLAKECGAAFAQSTAVTAGICAGITLYTVVDTKVRIVRKRRTAMQTTAKIES